MTAVVSLPESRACSGADRIDSAKKTIAALAHLPLHRSGGTAGKGDRHGAVILGTAIGLWTRGISEVAADVAGVELNRVQAGVHVEPGRIDRKAGDIGVGSAVDAAVITRQQDAG